MKKFLFFLSLCLGVLRVERKRKEEKKAQETPFISDVLFSLLCSPSLSPPLSPPHSRFFLPSVLPLKQIISNEIRKRRQRKKTERERKKLSVQQVGKFCCQVEVKVAPAVATECGRGGEGGQEGRRSKMNSWNCTVTQALHNLLAGLLSRLCANSFASLPRLPCLPPFPPWQPPSDCLSITVQRQVACGKQQVTPVLQCPATTKFKHN